MSPALDSVYTPVFATNLEVSFPLSRVLQGKQEPEGEKRQEKHNLLVKNK